MPPKKRQIPAESYYSLLCHLYENNRERFNSNFVLAEPLSPIDDDGVIHKCLGYFLNEFQYEYYLKQPCWRLIDGVALCEGFPPLLEECGIDLKKQDIHLGPSGSPVKYNGVRSVYGHALFAVERGQLEVIKRADEWYIEPLTLIVWYENLNFRKISGKGKPVRLPTPLIVARDRIFKETDVPHTPSTTSIPNRPHIPGFPDPIKTARLTDELISFLDLTVSEIKWDRDGTLFERQPLQEDYPAMEKNTWEVFAFLKMHYASEDTAPMHSLFDVCLRWMDINNFVRTSNPKILKPDFAIPTDAELNAMLSATKRILEPIRRTYLYDQTHLQKVAGPTIDSNDTGGKPLDEHLKKARNVKAETTIKLYEKLTKAWLTKMKGKARSFRTEAANIVAQSNKVSRDTVIRAVKDADKWEDWK